MTHIRRWIYLSLCATLCYAMPIGVERASSALATVDASSGSPAACSSNGSQQRSTEHKLGIAKDIIEIGGKGVCIGFDVARFSTKFGFGIASAFIGGPGHLLEKAVGPNPLSFFLNGVDTVVGGAAAITYGVQDAAEAITHASIDVTKSGLAAVGAEDGALLREVLGDEAAEATLFIRILVTDYTQEMNSVSLADVASGAQAWGAMQQAVRIAADQHAQNIVKLPENSERWMRFALASYGSLQSQFSQGFSSESMTEAQLVNDRGGCSGEQALASAGITSQVDVVKFEPSRNDIYAPGYIVAVDHKTNTVVVSLRGTNSLKDALTDLDCEATPVQLATHDGLAHRGMWRAAQNLESQLATLVDQALPNLSVNTQRHVVVCGHSLGAGVAALVTAIWKDRGYFSGLDLQCFAFACPQVLDSSLAFAQNRCRRRK